jgi:hypothetical protein
MAMLTQWGQFVVISPFSSAFIVRCPDGTNPSINVSPHTECRTKMPHFLGSIHTNYPNFLSFIHYLLTARKNDVPRVRTNTVKIRKHLQQASKINQHNNNDYNKWVIYKINHNRIDKVILHRNETGLDALLFYKKVEKSTNSIRVLFLVRNFR